MLVKDEEARVRRRAALAIGRAKLPEGVALLTPLVQSDPELEVRQMAAFALGLIGRKEAAPTLRTALSDTSPVVRGRAAEALGLIGDTESAPAIGVMVGTYVKAGALSKLSADESAYPLAPEIEAARLGIFALTRLKAYDALATAVLDPSGAPVSAVVAGGVRVPPRGRRAGGSRSPRASERRRRLHAGIRRARTGRAEGRGQHRSAAAARGRRCWRTRRGSGSGPFTR